jgi:hypothetical protein
MTPPVLAPPSPGGFDLLLSALKPLLPVPVLLVVLPVLWRLFRSTWKELDDDATKWRAALALEGGMDLRPFVALAMCALILTLQEYYGGRAYFDQSIHPWLVKLQVKHPRAIKLAKYDELYGFGWWVATRVGGYTVLPFGAWKLCFPRDSLLDMGLRLRGFFQHIWIYGAFLAVVLPLVLIVSRQPDFGSYYPFYKASSRSWFDF